MIEADVSVFWKTLASTLKVVGINSMASVEN
jgi:hypothetical protein